MRANSSLFSVHRMFMIIIRFLFKHTRGTGRYLSPPIFQTLSAERALPHAPTHTLPFGVRHYREKAGAPLLRHPGESHSPSSFRHPGESRGPVPYSKDWIPAQRIRRDDDRGKEKGAVETEGEKSGVPLPGGYETLYHLSFSSVFLSPFTSTFPCYSPAPPLHEGERIMRGCIIQRT